MPLNKSEFGLGYFTHIFALFVVLIERCKTIAIHIPNI